MMGNSLKTKSICAQQWGKRESGFHMSSSSLHNDDVSSRVCWRGLLFANLLFHTLIFMARASQLCCSSRQTCIIYSNHSNNPLFSSSSPPYFSMFASLLLQTTITVHILKMILTLVFASNTFGWLKSTFEIPQHRKYVWLCSLAVK